MASKSNGKSNPSVKKESPKKLAAASTATSKSEKKPSPAKLNEKTQVEIQAATESEMTMVDPEELEEQEDAANSASSSGNAAALAAATGSSTEMSASFKNFRHHPDMENFYRFIYENDLRHEALAIIDEIMLEKRQRKLVKGAKAQAH